MLESMKNQSLTISMEADSIFGRVAVVSRRLPALFNTVKLFVSDLSSLDSLTSSNVVYSSNTVKAINALNKNTRYSAIREEPISVPSGFKGNLLEYATTLKDTVDLVSTIAETRLKIIETWLGESLNDTKKLASLNARLGGKDLAPLPLEKHRVKLAKFFDFNNLSTDSTFGACYSRIEDLNRVDRLVLEFSKKLDKNNRETTREAMVRVVKLIDRFIDVLETRGTELNVSPQVIKAVATKAYQLAEECDFYAVTYAQVVTLNESVESTANLLLAKYN